MVNPQFSPHDFMQYVIALKSFEGETQGLDVKGQLKFYRFNFTLDNVANIVLNSMGKSIKCIEIPNEFIEQVSAGNQEYDFNSTLPSQDNLPSTEEMEEQFISYLNDMLEDFGFEEDNSLLYDILDWANNDELFTPVARGERLMVVRGSSGIKSNSQAVVSAVSQAYGDQGHSKRELQRIRTAIKNANAMVTRSYSRKRMADERNAVLAGAGVFADAQASVDFYNSLTDPELKKRALMNTRGYLSTLQFDLNRSQVMAIESHAGEYSALPSGQSSVDIGTIFIGAQYVQEVLNRLTEELNQSIFAIFQSVKDITEGTYAFMAGGLQDDGEAQKAINASRSVEEKTQELRPGGGGTSGGSSGVIDTRMGAGRPTKPFKFPAE